MKKKIQIILPEIFKTVDWRLFCFMVLVLNVKLVVKIAALAIIFLIIRKDTSLRVLVKQKFAWFYISMITIAAANFLLQSNGITVSYTVVTIIGILFWLLAIVASYEAFVIIQQTTRERINSSFDLFFAINLVIVFMHLWWVMIDAGTINPFTYKGLNQKYYVSTGDYIRGITFDSPVTTAMICAFGLFYFLYRKKYFLTVLSMAGLLVVSSNLTDIFVLLILLVIFIGRSDKIQKSVIVGCFAMFLAFIIKISPQNNELVVSLLYKLIDKPYYLPPVKIITNAELKQMPDSVLDTEQRKRKTGLLYIDSLSAVNAVAVTSEKVKTVAKDTSISKKIFYEYRPTSQVKDKENRFARFLYEKYDSVKRDEIKKQYDWELPGKWIAFQQTMQFMNQNPGKLWLGSGTGNFSSRLAFKATGLGMAGSYPAKYTYIHPFFLDAHLFVYLYYHSQWQIKHSASNTPDAVYMQLIGEYGIAGLVCFIVLYVVYFMRRIKCSGFGWALLLLLLSALWVEYWFEQLSVVILFELLVLAEIKSLHEKKRV